MKKFILSGLGVVSALLINAQDVQINTLILDEAEDTTQVTTIKDIIAVQELVSSSNSNTAHYADVWKRNSFFNLGYNMGGSLKPKQALPLHGYNNAPNVDNFDSDWGAMLQLGHSYCLHRKPIANMVQINLDYTFIDLNFNKYNEEKNSPAFDTALGNYNNNPLPWLAQKYSLSYGMSLGPSVTVAPLTMLNTPSLHFFKINAYYHIGYNIGLLGMSDHGKTSINMDYFSWGHGLMNSYGVNLSWKMIGIGWEARSDSPKYKSLDTAFGSDSYKFKSTSNRIYLTIRY